MLGFFAYDTGSPDSGIKDHDLKVKCHEWYYSLPDEQHRPLLSRLAREAFLTEEAIEQGYGIEDVAKFNEWIDWHFLGETCPP